MLIIPIDKKNNQIGTYGFTSFNEVFDWCLEELRRTEPRMDDILFKFEIRDTSEVFYIYGRPEGEDSVLYRDIRF